MESSDVNTDGFEDTDNEINAGFSSHFSCHKKSKKRKLENGINNYLC